MMKFFVKGGKYSDGKHGYVVCSANWDPYPMANDIEAFTNALANVGVVVTQRIYRFNNPFFTVIRASDVVPPEQIDQLAPQGDGYLTMHLWQQLQMLAGPVPAEGVSTDAQGNGDIESQAGIKAVRARQAVDVMLQLLGQDLLTGSYWMNLRKTQDPTRSFGPGPEAALAALRRVIPWQAPSDVRAAAPAATLAYEFVRATAVASLFPAAASEPGGESRIPIADAPPTP
jgi:histidine ammonia-lyase